MNVLFVGAGGVGGYFAYKLSQAGIDVSLLVRGKHGETIAANGLRLSGIENATLRCPALREVSAKNRFDLIFLASKLVDLDSALTSIAACLTPETTLVTLQNGIDAEAMVQRRFPKQPLIGGVAYVDALIQEPGLLQIGGAGRLALGEISKGTQPLCERLKELFEKVGVPLNASTDIRATKWRKLAWNAVFGPLCTITRSTMGDIRGNPDLLQVGERLIGELVTVGRACGVELPEDLPKIVLDQKVGQSAGNPKTRTSMWFDFSTGRETEIDYLNGAIARLGREHGIETPWNSAVTALIHSLEKSRGRTP